MDSPVKKSIFVWKIMVDVHRGLNVQRLDLGPKLANASMDMKEMV